MGFIAVAIVVIIALAVHSVQLGKANRAWGRVAETLGLDLSPAKGLGTPVLSGDVDGLAVRVDVATKGSSNNRSSYTRYHVRHRPVGPVVAMSKQGTFSGLGRLIGRKDVKIGDPFFDERVVIDTNDTTAIQLFLTPARRAAVLDLFTSFPSGKITHDSVEMQKQRVERNPMRLQATLMRLVETAEVMGEPGEVDEIIELQGQGMLGRSAEMLHDLNGQRPNAFTESLEAEALVEMGRHAEAAQIFDELNARLPEDPSRNRWSHLAHLPPPPNAPPPPGSPPPAALPRSLALETADDWGDEQLPDAASVSDPDNSTALGQQHVIDDLFRADRMSWEIVEYFEGAYRNAIVQWNGELTTFNTYRHDSDFGDGPGMKAHVLLGRAGNSEFISNEVHAVVEFPAGTKLVRGTEIGFRATLTHVDRFSRKLYLRFGSLIA